MAKAAGPDPLWTIEEVAALFRVSTQTLYHWRKTGYGPKAGRVGKHLRYRETEVRAFYETVMQDVA